MKFFQNSLSQEDFKEGYLLNKFGSEILCQQVMQSNLFLEVPQI
jgi:hypothetical protein